jgi:hypothetical protein
MQTGTVSSQVSSAYAAYTDNKTQNKVTKENSAKSEKASKTGVSSLAVKEDKELGKTVGQPQLSEAAQEYYNSLKEKYGDYDFVLVSSDMKDAAQANASMYANTSKTVILIDEEKIEKMATDEAYREKYEGIIANASNQLQQLRESIISSGANISSYGATINDDGTASYFAVVDKSLKAQQERIENKRAEAKEKAKEDAKAKAKKEKEEKLKEKRAESADDEQDIRKSEDKVTITADSIQELVNKISDSVFDTMSDNAETEQEKSIGHNFDFSV